MIGSQVITPISDQQGKNLACIMQPTYLPWLGFFNLIYHSDVFVFYDDAEFSKGSWHNRNRILMNNVASWITVPVKHKNGVSISSIEINEPSRALRKNIGTLSSVYGRAPFYKDLNCILEFIRQLEFKNLGDLNISIITKICDFLGLASNFLKSSDMQFNGDRCGKLVSILTQVGASEYLSPVGAREYLEEDNFSDLSEVPVQFQDFEIKEYDQFNNKGTFVSHLSVLDAIANVGFDQTSKLIKGV